MENISLYCVISLANFRTLKKSVYVGIRMKTKFHWLHFKVHWTPHKSAEFYLFGYCRQPQFHQNSIFAHSKAKKEVENNKLPFYISMSIEWSSRAFASMRAVRLFLRARAA